MTVSVPPVLRVKIKVPTLAIAGADDPGAPVSLFHRARVSFTGPYQVAAIPGGHFCHRESPAQFAQAVLAFIAG